MYLWEQINNHSNSVNTIMSDSLVLIPTYNEKENIENIIRAVFALPKSFHILVIDDNSPDGIILLHALVFCTMKENNTHHQGIIIAISRDKNTQPPQHHLGYIPYLFWLILKMQKKEHTKIHKNLVYIRFCVKTQPTDLCHLQPDVR